MIASGSTAKQSLAVAKHGSEEIEFYSSSRKVYIAIHVYILSPYPTTTPSTNDSKNARCTFIQATVLTLTPHSLSADGVLCFDYAVYALRSRLPAPLDLWSASHATRAIHLRRTKAEASASVVVSTLSLASCPLFPLSHLSTSNSDLPYIPSYTRSLYPPPSPPPPPYLHRCVPLPRILHQFAPDIATVHPTKRVTLLHSRARLLPRFDGSAGSAGGGSMVGVRKRVGDARGELILLFMSPPRLHALNVHVVLRERVDLSSLSPTTSVNDTTMVRTTTGKEGDWDIWAEW
ncbi:hypothetical protein B0H13DRAFT_2330428 [Mycena leptocephala]|nr:hypothetical protein B0H13DRAFT_2330428 [Mycena leptocephala]